MRPNQPAGLTPKDIMSILRRHIWLIIVLSIMGLIAGSVTWYLMQRYYPKYRAHGLISVLPPVEKDPMQMTSTVVNKDIQYEHRQTIAHRMRHQSMLEKLLTRDKIKQTNWYKNQANIESQKILEAYGDLKDNLGISAHRDSGYIEVSMTCGNKKEAALIVNEVIFFFVSEYGNTKIDQVQGKLVELKNRKTLIENDLQLAERSLDEVRKYAGVTDLEVHTFRDTITVRLEDLEEEERELSLNVSQLETQIEQLERQTQGSVDDQDQVKQAIERDPTMIRLTQQLLGAQTSLAQALTKYGERHKIIRELRERIRDLQDRKITRKREIGDQTRRANLKDAQDEYVIFNKRLLDARKQREAAAKQKKALDSARVQYDKRVAIRDQLRDNLNEIKELIGKRQIEASDPDTPKVSPASMARPPNELSSPLWYVYIPAGAFLGFAISVGLAFLVELLNDLLRTPRDIVQHIKIPLLSVVPHSDEDKSIRGVDLCHVMRLSPYSIVSESYRQLQTNLKLSREAQDTKVIFVSSCGPGEGKTTVSINLATALIATGKKVLLIDSNLWRSMIHKAFPKSGLSDRCDLKAKSDIGLSNYLSGEVSAEQIIRSSGLDGFDVIDSGPVPGNPNEAVASNSMIQLISGQRNNYDHIIIDGPPLLLVSGAKVLAQDSDGIILVFNADLTRRGAAQRAVRELKEINVNLIGCVLVGARALKGGYFQQQFKVYRKYQTPVMAT